MPRESHPVESDKQGRDPAGYRGEGVDRRNRGGQPRIVSLSQADLSPILERKRFPQDTRVIPRIPLDTLLVTILDKANEFVPSSSGSILLDDPLQKLQESARRELVFVCCFGELSDRILGRRIPVGHGITGAVYSTGASILTNNAYGTPEFNDELDRRFVYTTKSVLCVAIRIGNSVCGVIELVNKRGGGEYREGERQLLEIFAQYISSTIQNAVDAKKIERMVRMDDLTGLANDRMLLEQLPLEIAESVQAGRPLSVLFLDLDRFKEINDTHGHLAGSRTLAEFGRLLAGCVDRAGATLSRYGGDEFVILLPCTERAEAAAIAEAIRLETASHVFLDRPWGENEAPLHLGGIITASIGVSTLRTTPDADCDPGDQNRLAVRLLQNADRALYQAKTSGKNRVIYLPTDSVE
jgi:diguanylate cyclase (GGDEF)-like protein